MKDKIIIGVSAHRNIAEKCKSEVSKLLLCVFRELKTRFPEAEIITLNGLAAGGDMLCAEAALECGVKIKAVLPVPEELYLNSRDFTEEQCARYFKIKRAANISQAFAISEGFGSGERERDAAFRAQTEYVATKCDYLLALWDGVPDDHSEGCGAAAAVKFAHEKGIKVIWIYSPREGKAYSEYKPFARLI